MTDKIHSIPTTEIQIFRSSRTSAWILRRLLSYRLPPRQSVLRSSKARLSLEHCSVLHNTCQKTPPKYVDSKMSVAQIANLMLGYELSE